MVNLADSQQKTQLVFIHGWGASNATWKPLCDSFSFEYQGHYFALDDFYETVQQLGLERALTECVNKLPENCILVGWSLGGMLATRLACASPEKVKGLICLATNINFVATDSWPCAMERSQFDRFVKGFSNSPEKTFARFQALQVQGDSQAKALLHQLKSLSSFNLDLKNNWMLGLGLLERLANEDSIKDLGVPFLYLFGEQDKLVPHAAAKEISDIQNARCELSDVKVIENAGHALHLSAVECVEQEIKQFTKAIRSKPAFFASSSSLDKQTVANSFGRAAATYDKSVILQPKVADKLLARIPQKFAGKVVDLGSGTGYCTEKLVERGYQMISLDLSKSMLDYARKKSLSNETIYVHADMEALPFCDNSCDAVISSLSFQWSENPARLFGEVHRILKPGGFLLFSTLCEKTLFELKQAWNAVDSAVHVNQFKRESDLFSLLLGQRFRLLEFEVHQEMVEYNSAIELMKELKNIGAHNVNRAGKKGLTTRRQLQRVCDAYEQFRNEKAKLPATYEVLYCLARKPHV